MMESDNYRELFERNADANSIIVGDRFVDCNEALLKMLGFNSKERFLNTHPSQISPERQSDGRLSFEKANEMIAIAFQQGSHRFEWEHLRADGEVFPVEVLLTAIRQGEQPALHVVWRDITDRKNAEAALQKAYDEMEKRVHERTAALVKINQQMVLEKKKAQDYLEVANDLLVALNVAGEVTLINPRGCEILGYEAKDILGKNWFAEFLPESCRSALQDVFFRILCGEDNLLANYENPVRTADGSERILGFHNALLRDPQGRPSGVLSSGADLTEQKKAEEEKKTLQAYLFQQEKMASIGQLAAGVAHEINNPMGFITSNLGTLGKYAGNLLTFIDAQAEAIRCLGRDNPELDALRKRLKIDYIREDVNELLAESLDGATRVRDIVQSLKSFSRVDNKLMQPADINACLDSTIKVVWNEIKYKATLHRDYGSLPLVVCNAQQLNQVFVNLLTNAVHAIRNQGEIRVRTWHEPEWIHVSICDNGCGIPQANLSRIFEPFYTTKEVGKGTGLGLSISYDIIKRHRGNIAVESLEGKGTCFTVSVPLQGALPDG